MTSLLFNRRVSKSSPRVHAYGTVDELNSSLGVLRAWLNQSGDYRSHGESILAIQKQLIQLMGELATHADDMDRYAKAGFISTSGESADLIETLIRDIELKGLKLDGWVMPGDNLLSASADQARTTCRRAEREVIRLLEDKELANQHIAVYLNRLSDYLWMLARDLENKSI